MEWTSRRVLIGCCVMLAASSIARADDWTTWDAGECGVRVSIPSGVTVSARQDGNLYKADFTHDGSECHVVCQPGTSVSLSELEGWLPRYFDEVRASDCSRTALGDKSASYRCEKGGSYYLVEANKGATCDCVLGLKVALEDKDDPDVQKFLRDARSN